MKTAKEWDKEYQAQRHLPDSQRTLIHRNGSFTRAIQLDAMKEGMRRAVNKMEYIPAGNDYNEVYNYRNALQKTILTTAEQLTEKDLPK